MRRTGKTPDRMEAAGEVFHDKVQRGYRALAAADAARWVVVDGAAAPGAVAAAVWEAVVTRLPDLGRLPSPARPE